MEGKELALFLMKMGFYMEYSIDERKHIGDFKKG